MGTFYWMCKILILEHILDALSHYIPFLMNFRSDQK